MILVHKNYICTAALASKYYQIHLLLKGEIFWKSLVKQDFDEVRCDNENFMFEKDLEIRGQIRLGDKKVS